MILAARTPAIRRPFDQLLAQARGDGLRAHLMRGVVGGLALRIAGRGLGLVSSILLARLLGAEGYGVYAYAMVLVALLLLPATLGLPGLVVRQVAVYREREQWSLLRGLLARASQSVLLVATLSAAGAGVVGWALAGRFDPVALATFWVALALLPVLALGAVQQAALQGLRHVVLGQMPENVLRPGLFVLLVLGFLLLGPDPRPLTPVSAMALQVVAVVLALACGAWWLARRLPAGARRSAPAFDARGWMAGALPFVALGGIELLHVHVDVLMVGLLRSAEEVGVYRIAATLAVFVSFGLIAVNAAVAPHIARLHAQGDRRRLQRVATGAARATFALGLPPALALVAFGASLLGFLFGDEFRAGSLALAILCVGQLLNAAFGPVGLMLNMTGHGAVNAWLGAAGVALNVALNALLIPPFGIDGAAAATAVAVVFWPVAASVVLTRRLDLRVAILRRRRS